MLPIPSASSVIRSAAAGLRVGALISACLLGKVEPAQARSAGIAAGSCDGCHRGGQAPLIKLTSDIANPAVGQAITLTIDVSQTNGSSAGFYLTTLDAAPGSFKAVESGTIATATDVMHTTPHVGSGGTTTFKAQWTPSAVAGVEFDVAVVSADADRTDRGDGAGTARLQLAIGCTGSTYYIDQDGDGFGSADPAYASRLDCSAPAGYLCDDDCDDRNAGVYPGGTEVCDGRDNNCDGSVDEGVRVTCGLGVCTRAANGCSASGRPGAPFTARPRARARPVRSSTRGHRPPAVALFRERAGPTLRLGGAC